MKIAIKGKGKNEKVARLIRNGFPWYRKHAVHVRIGTTVELQGTAWFEGSRSDYYWFNTITGESRSIGVSRNPAQFGGPTETPTVETGGHRAVVEGGFFCGKASTLMIVINPDDVGAIGDAYREAVAV